MNREKICEDIYNNFDNIETLDIIDYLLGVVLGDIEYMNEEDLDNEEVETLDLGNNYYITREDLETIVSARETIQNIVNYNK